MTRRDWIVFGVCVSCVVFFVFERAVNGDWLSVYTCGFAVLIACVYFFLLPVIARRSVRRELRRWRETEYIRLLELRQRAEKAEKERRHFNSYTPTSPLRNPFEGD